MTDTDLDAVVIRHFLTAFALSRSFSLAERMTMTAAALSYCENADICIFLDGKMVAACTASVARADALDWQPGQSGIEH